MRLNQFISSTGYCSRREADRLIASGDVKINGIVAELGMTAEEGDVVEVKGTVLSSKEKHVYIAFNKPIGITCTTESHIKGNIIDYINHRERIFPIGRLDKDSEGLILLTSDGTIVNTILRSENNHEKEYIVTLDRPFDDHFLEDMANGVKIFNPVAKEYVITKKCVVKEIDERTFSIILTQGYNRQIRRMVSQFGYQVAKLKRIRIADITLENIPRGKYRNLTEDEIKKFK